MSTVGEQEESIRVSVRKACALLGYSYPTVLALVQTGKIHSIEVGHHYEISVAEIRRFKKDGNVPPNERVPRRLRPRNGQLPPSAL